MNRILPSLTAQLWRLALKNSFGLGHVVKGNSKAPIVKLDLTTPEEGAVRICAL